MISAHVIFMTLLSAGMLMADELVLDDFANPDTVSSYGTEWEGFTDQVMGGRSDISVRMLRENEKFFLRMEGNVSLENNGGFIQVRLMLEKNGRMFDASGYRGIKIRYRYRIRQPGGYYLHLRTKQTRFPWAHFAAPIPPAVGEWTEAEVPWEAFERKYTLSREPKLNSLKSIAVTAANDEFEASIDIGYIGLY